ncbi:hypothetical protein BIW11_13840 [Tropilaelaps mercedesae]|uniref:Uncharacterized protein n=1 Tax=Tropilaelaps mercedesae TaxID=418985 RepID=A0A1V9X079_9ACAR|nr:hypothetical protein BIW11_13840 [Tropilaelaps mercedesae]
MDRQKSRQMDKQAGR